MAKYLHQTYVRSTPDFRQTMKSKLSKHRQQTCVRSTPDLCKSCARPFNKPINRLCKTFHHNNYERSFADLSQTCEDMVRPQNEKW